IAGIPNSVTKFHPAEPNLVRKAALRPVPPQHVRGSVVLVKERLKAVLDQTSDAVVLFVRETIKHVHVVRDFPVQLCDTFRFTKWRIEGPRQRSEITCRSYRVVQILLEPFCIGKKEQLVFNQKATQIPAEVIALKRQLSSRNIRRRCRITK